MAIEVGKIRRLIKPHPIFFDWLNKVDIETILKKVQLTLDDFLRYKPYKAIFHKFREEKSPWEYFHETKLEWIHSSWSKRRSFFEKRKKSKLADMLLYATLNPKKEKEEIFKRFCEDHVIPGEPNFNRIVKDLNDWREKHRNIFDELIKGRMVNQNDQLEQIIAYNKKNLISQPYSEKLGIKLKYDAYAYESLTEWVEINYLLNPLLEENEEFFLAIKKCEFCSNFYFAYTNKAKYCSDKCKTATYRQKKARLLSE